MFVKVLPTPQPASFVRAWFEGKLSFSIQGCGWRVERNETMRHTLLSHVTNTSWQWIVTLLRTTEHRVSWRENFLHCESADFSKWVWSMTSTRSFVVRRVFCTLSPDCHCQKWACNDSLIHNKILINILLISQQPASLLWGRASIKLFSVHYINLPA